MRPPQWSRRLLVPVTLCAAVAGTLAIPSGPASASRPAQAAAAGVTAAKAAPPPVELGRKYYMRSRLNWSKCAEMPRWSTKNSTQADIWTCKNQNNVKWIVTSAGQYGIEDTYFIKNANSKKCLNVAGYSYKKGAKIIQYKCSAQLNGRWRFYRHGSYWELWNMGTGGFVNIAGGKAVNGAKLIQWNKAGYANQDFFFDLA
jgi:hypothetical protein